MKSSALARVRCFAALVLCSMTTINCYCGGDESLEVTAPRSFFFINGTNNLASARAEVFAGSEVIQIPGNVDFGEVSAKHTVTRNSSAMSARVRGVSSAWQGESDPSLIGGLNIIVSSSIPGANAVDLETLGDYSNPLIHILRDRGPDVDVYVTAPGANLATLQKDATLTKLGQLQTLDFRTLHPNTQFQVRLTQAGTKNVLVDFGTQPGLAGGNHRVLLHIHLGNTPQQRAFTFNARQ